jgi:hypothetical protein
MLSPQPAVPDPERASFDTPRIGSDRNFGLIFAAFFVVPALWPVVRGNPIRVWSLIVAGLFFGAAIFLPRMLSVPNWLWFRFGLLLGKVLTPIIMGTLFLAAILPVALLLRLFRKDIIRLRSDPSLKSYWISKASDLTPESLNDQF